MLLLFFINKIKNLLQISEKKISINGLDASIWVPWSPSDPKKSWSTVKAEFTLVGNFFHEHSFLPWEILLIKKLDIEKTKTTQYTTFKTDITKVVLVFLFPPFY
jgi:hypothetical protein